MRDEKRRYERLAIKENVISHNSKINKGIDVSLGGIQVSVEDPMETGKIIDMEFYIPGNPNKFMAQAKVVWQQKTKNGYNTGLEFQKVRVIKEK